MVALVPDNTDPARRFVAEFNQSLAQAKMDSLALLHRLVVEGLRSAGSTGPSLETVPPAGVGRESRLAAAQVLRTPFLRINDEGVICNDHRRSRATDSGRRNRCPAISPSEEPAGLRRIPDMGLVDVPARRDGTPELIPPALKPPQNPSACSAPLREIHPGPTVPDSAPQDPTHTTQNPSVSSVLSVVNPNSSGETRLVQLESMRADLARATRGLCGADQKRIVKQALATLRAKARAPT